VWFGSPLETTFLANQGNPKQLQFTGAPGIHEIVLVTVKNGQQSQYRKRITIGNSDPRPDPRPEPRPDPTPTPVAGLLHATLVYDQEIYNPEILEILANEQIRNLAKELKFKWRTYDDDSNDLKKVGLDQIAAEVGPPALIIQSDDGTVIRKEKAPRTVEETISRLKTFRSNFRN
jgi:hypothetical protein